MQLDIGIDNVETIATKESKTKSDRRDPILFATNRYNLLEILSSGVVAPRAAYDKYYQDLLEVSEGRIPLFRDSIDRDIEASCTSEGTGTFPVLVELSSNDANSIKVASLGTSGRERRGTVGDGASLAWAPTGPFALSRGSVVHFRTETELEEHRLQEYENIRHEDWRYRLSPERFSGSDGKRVLAWLSSLPSIDKPTAEDFKRVDKQGGAIALAAGASDGEMARALWTRNIDAPTARTSSLPTYFSYLNDYQRHGIDRESRLFYAIISTLKGFDSKSFAASSFLDAVGDAEELRGLGHSDHEFVKRTLDRLRAVVGNEVEFTGFPSSEGSSVARALMLLVLRPEPRRLASWNPKEINASELVKVIALAFCGYLWGRKRLPVSYRPSEVDQAIARNEVATLQAPSTLRGAKKSKGAPTVSISDLLTQFKEAADEQGRKDAARALAAACGWKECFRKEYVLSADDVETHEQGLVRVRIPLDAVARDVFSEGDFREHLRLQFGVSVVEDD